LKKIILTFLGNNSKGESRNYQQGQNNAKTGNFCPELPMSSQQIVRIEDLLTRSVGELEDFFAEFHRASHPDKQKVLNLLLKAPQGLLESYLRYCGSHYSDAGLDNLHFLLSHPGFASRELVLSALVEINSQRSVDFLYTYAASCSLHLKKQILKSLQNFPQTQPHSALLDCLGEQEYELKVLSLELIAKLESFDKLSLLEKQLESPFPLIQKLALKSLKRFFGTQWMHNILMRFPSLSGEAQLLFLGFYLEQDEDLSLEILEKYTPNLEDLETEVLLKLFEILPKKVPHGFQRHLAGLLTHPENRVRLGVLEVFSRQGLSTSSLEAIQLLLTREKYINISRLAAQCIFDQPLDEALEICCNLVSSHLEAVHRVLLPFFKTHVSQSRVDGMIREYLETYSSHTAYMLQIISEPQDFYEELVQISESKQAHLRKAVKPLLLQCEAKNAKKLLAQAEDWFLSQDHAQALWTLEDVLKLEPANLKALTLKARCHLRGGDESSCEEILKEVLRKSPDHFQALKLLVSFYLETNRPKQAAPLLKKCSELQFQEPDILEKLFECHYKLDNFEFAFEAYSRIPKEFLRLESTVQFLEVATRLKKYNALVQAYELHLASGFDVELQVDYRSKALYGLALYHSEKLEQAEQLFLELQEDFEPSDEKVNAWKLISGETNEPQWEGFFLEALKQAHPGEVSYQLTYLEFLYHYDPERCLKAVSELAVQPAYQKIQARALRKLARFDESCEILELIFLENPSDESIPLELGLNYLEKEEYRKALKYFQYYERQSYLPPKLHYYLCQCYTVVGYRDLALKHLCLALQEKSPCLQAWYLYVDVLSQGASTQELRQFLRQAEAALAEDSAGLLKLAGYYQSIQDEKAFSLLESVLEMEPDNREIHRVLATHYYRCGRFASAYSHFHKIRDDLPESLLEEYSDAAEKSLNYAEAFHLYLKLAQDERRREKLRSRMDRLIAHRDSFYHIMGHLSETIVMQNEEVLKHFPLFYYKLGTRVYHEGNLKAAKRWLEILKTHHTAFLRSDFFLGMISMHEGEPQEALKHFESALAHEDPKPMQCHALLGEISFDQGDFEGARRHYIKVFQSGKNTRESLEYLFQIYQKEDQCEKFIHLVNHSRSELMEDPAVRFLMARAKWHEGAFEEAHVLFGSIESGSPYHPQAVYQGALCLMRLEDFKQAASDLASLKTETESFVKLYFYQGVCLKTLHKFQSAVEMFKCSLEFQEDVTGALFELTDTYLKTVNPEKALPFFLDLASREFSFDLCYELCKQLYGGKHFQELTEVYKHCMESILEEPSEDSKIAILQGFVLAFSKSSEEDLLYNCLKAVAHSHPGTLKSLVSQSSLRSSLKADLLERASKLLPSDYIFPYLLGNQAYAKKEYQAATLHYVRAQSLIGDGKLPSEHEFQLNANLATIYYEAGEHSESLKCLNHAVRLKPDHVESLEKSSFVYGLLNSRDQQARIDQKLFFLKSENSRISMRLYSWFQAKGDQQNAIFHLKNYLSEFKDDKRRWDLLADLSRQAGMYSQELQAYHSLEGLGSSLSADHFLKVGRAYLALKREEKAAECFQKHLSKNPDHPGLHFQLAMIYKGQSYLKKAKMALREILRKDPVNTTALYELAEVCFQEQDIEECEEILRSLLQITPFHQSGGELLAKIHYKRGDNTKAMTALEQVLKSAPDNSEARLMQARLFRTEGMLDEACSIYEALYRETKNQEYLLELGVLNLKLNRKNAALKHLRSLVESPGTNSRLHKMANNLLRQQND
jgi:tetratricopeptide (TPR) repeat protein